VRTKVEELPESRVRLEVEVPEEDVQHALEHAASDLAGSLRIPGFRKGKAPVQVVAARVGREALWEEAVRSHLDGWFWSAAATSSPNIAKASARRRENAPDPTELIMIDEADRLKTASLEQVRDIFDHGGIGVVFIGMPGIEKRLSRYPQLYSRVGFVHAFRPLSAAQVRDLLQRKWVPSGVALPKEGIADEEARTAIIRVTGGNFRLLHRLLTQIARLVEINALQTVTSQVVEAARESLVIGTA